MPEQQKPRIEVVTPPWVKDPSKWPFSKVILPPTNQGVTRLLIDADELTRQLRCPSNLVTAFLRTGQIHEATDQEKSAELGLCAEDLTALALAGHLCTKYKLKLIPMIFQAIGDLRSELLQAPLPLRVILGVLRANKRIEARVGTCHGELAIWDCPSDQSAVTDFYDASSLRDRMDGAIQRTPLVLPRADSCIVSRPK